MPASRRAKSGAERVGLACMENISNTRGLERAREFLGVALRGGRERAGLRGPAGWRTGNGGPTGDMGWRLACPPYGTSTFRAMLARGRLNTPYAC